MTEYLENHRPIYLDHAATTPLDPLVLEKMLPYMSEMYANPSSLYSMGQQSRIAVDNSREKIASILNCRPTEIIFTSGGTESDNTAIKGGSQGLSQQGNHIITSSIEHHAVLNTFYQMQDQGYDTTFIKVGSDGLVNPQDILNAMTDKTVLVSIMHVNNEVGTIQPIKEITKLVKEKADSLNTRVLVHTDAVQAPGYLSLDVEDLGVDLMSLSAHKFYGPKGVGILYKKRRIPFVPLISGGGQESNDRSGTENVPGIIGISVALDLVSSKIDETVSKVGGLQSRLMSGIEERIPKVILNGHRTKRVVNNLNYSFSGIEAEPVLLGLDLSGVYASSGSACSTASLEPSHVLMAMGLNVELARSSLRFTLGANNNEKDVDYAVNSLASVIEQLRSMSSFGR